MTIRVRLVLLCLVVSLLPAIPLSFLVQTLIEKSFDVGLNATVEEALKSGTAISRKHLARLHEDFEHGVVEIVTQLESADEDYPDSGTVAHISSADDTIRCVVVSSRAGAKKPPAQEWVTQSPEFLDLVNGESIVERDDVATSRNDIMFFDTEDRAIQLSVWCPRTDTGIGSDTGPGSDSSVGPGASCQGSAVIFFARTDPAFLYDANRLIDGRQVFAELRLTKPTLSRSFFYPFVVIYSVILVVSLLVALFMAERMANPIRRLAAGADAVSAGDWTYRLEERSGGEVGRLVDAFNTMVSRLEGQQRRLVDMERIATWREMARHLAHEIKNPLLPIRLTVEELKDQYKGDDPRYKKLVGESVHVIGEELDHLQRLVKEFSSFARMPDINPRISSLDTLAGDVARLYPHPAIEVASGPGIVEFSFDPDQMRRVLVNLLDNAVAAVMDVDNPVIRIRLERSDGLFVLTVSDNGSGVQPEYLGRIFDPYFTTKEEGSGLGLAMVKNIILLHGGTIDVESREGQGTAFKIVLPIAGPVTGVNDFVLDDG